MTTADPRPARVFGKLLANPLMLSLAATFGGLAFLFAEAIGNLWMRWGQQQELSHSYFIPLISLWLVYSNRIRLQQSIGAPSMAGAAIIGAALALLMLGKLTSIFLFEHVGLVVATGGLVAAFGGLSLLRATAAPVAFLFFAVPPPYWLITVLSWKFQEMSSIIGVGMIELMGIPVHLSGNIIDLGDYKLQVAEACSGLRYLFPFLSLGVMAAYMYRGPLWHKAAIVLATIPITIAMNSLRIALTGALVQAYGSQHAEGVMHLFEGWVVFLLCLAALFGVIALLARFLKPRVGALDALASPELPVVAPSKGKLPPPAVFVSGGALLLAAFGAAQALTVDALITPERRDFDEVAAEFDGWKADIRPIDPSVAEVLGADDTIVINLISPQGEPFNLYMAYLNAQRDGRSWHSPRQCIPGGGWKIVEHTIVSRRTLAGKPHKLNRMLIQNGDYRQLVYYWYDQRGRKMANEFVMKFWLIADAVMRKRSDGAMIRLITPIEGDMTLEDADKKLTAMTERVESFLPDYVPE
jgi:exosortase D (VPLPA-CTERM-specific)